MNFTRKTFVTILNFLLGNPISLFGIGIVNKIFQGSLIKSVFLLYPANKKYADKYAFKWFLRIHKYNPTLLGIYWQNKSVGLTFGISTSDDDFYKASNKKNVVKVFKRMEKIRKILGASQCTFAGILPSVFAKHGIKREIVEGVNTSRIVTNSVSKIIDNNGNSLNTIIFVIGGYGFIGSKVTEQLSTIYKQVFPIDISNKSDYNEILKVNKNETVILVNCSKKNTISEYTKDLNHKTIVVNEVYPEPNGRELEEMHKRQIECYHIAGAYGKAIPAFPKAYQGGIPACATIMNSDVRDDNIILKKLN